MILRELEEVVVIGAQGVIGTHGSIATTDAVLLDEPVDVVQLTVQGSEVSVQPMPPFDVEKKGMKNGLFTVVLLLLAIVCYFAGHARGLTQGALRATRREVVQIDDILSRWRREQGP